MFASVFRHPLTGLLRPVARLGLGLLRLLWAGPLTLFGLLLALPVWLRGGRLRILRGQACALLADGPAADWLLQRHPMGAMNAMAIGHVVVAARDGLSSRILTHELEHVRQAERWGPLFPLLYLGSSSWQWLRGRNLYWHNHFEVAARAAEKSTHCKPMAGA